MVILGSDFYLTSLDNIQKHIGSLPRNIQPKLFVMQPCFNAPLQRHGLFEQVANPLQILPLQQGIYNLLASDKMANSKLNASKFTEHQYLATQVEVLFAVEDPTKHLALLRILQWLGLQLKIVCQPEALLKFWSSGRYLLLFTEFEQSPFIEMAAGKDVRRDIFTFNQSNFSIKENLKLADKSVVSIVPALNDIDSLVSLLQPWLKAKHTNVVSIDKLAVQNNEERRSISAEVRATPQEIDEVLSLVESAPKTSKREVFNLVKYAQNQGSAELAIVMLDDYIADIDQAMEKLSIALEAQNYQQGVSLVNSLIKTSTILATQDFTDFSQRLLSVLNQDKEIEHLRVMELLGELVDQKRLLSQFAEAI
jgi:hypothetical protein